MPSEETPNKPRHGKPISQLPPRTTCKVLQEGGTRCLIQRRRLHQQDVTHPWWIGRPHTPKEGTPEAQCSTALPEPDLAGALLPVIPHFFGMTAHPNCTQNCPIKTCPFQLFINLLFYYFIIFYYYKMTRGTTSLSCATITPKSRLRNSKWPCPASEEIGQPIQN